MGGKSVLDAPYELLASSPSESADALPRAPASRPALSTVKALLVGALIVVRGQYWAVSNSSPADPLPRRSAHSGARLVFARWGGASAYSTGLEHAALSLQCLRLARPCPRRGRGHLTGGQDRARQADGRARDRPDEPDGHLRRLAGSVRPATRSAARRLCRWSTGQGDRGRVTGSLSRSGLGWSRGSDEGHVAVDHALCSWCAGLVSSFAMALALDRPWFVHVRVILARAY